MEYLKRILKDYKAHSRKVEVLIDQGTEKLKIGDVFCIYGEDLVYGVVVEDIGEVYKAVYLTPELILAGDGHELRVDHLVSALKVTPIALYLTPEMIKYCEVVMNLPKDELAKVKESYENKASRGYQGVWKEFYDFEALRIEIFYEKFLEYLSKVEEDQAEEVIIDLSEKFGGDELRELFPQKAAASTSKTREEGLLIEVLDDAVIVYFSDVLIGKQANIYIQDKLIFSGRIPQEIKFKIGFEVPAETFKQKLRLQIEDA
ncbi:hypothetical protein SAMN04488510_12723 [Fervidobacterium changbaicum]|uniref:Uncharacterized protein n=1 Tax=Fervidobacterium changbaicum TaxID=310769 RepID=A0AAE5XBK5_9BACT|nr:hypothetical protein [Fervidobacterium changbaicum]QAV33179.1 hypothetical protein CBS1_05190 [Fervidobacterium changbaicum]SDH70894.1 hypothetical protein SAMN04488510_12723 [Fervidobacterium changbaicum]